MLCNSEQETTQRFLPLTRYLSDKVGVDFVMVPVDTNDFEKRFKAGEFTVYPYKFAHLYRSARKPGRSAAGI